MRNTLFLRSPTRRNHASDKGGNDEVHRSSKRVWKFYPHVFVSILILLFVAMIKTSQRGPSSLRVGAYSDGADGSPRPSLHLLGERHSGTKWMTDHLTECFGQNVEVRKSFSAWKHWFQEENPDVERAVVVAQFRNPFYWVEAMHRFPHHSPEHFDLDWQTFLQKPWTMPRFAEDLEFEGSPEKERNEIQCKNAPSFGPHELIPCMANWTIIQELPSEDGHRIVDAFYELRHDGSGQPYDSLLALRRDKIQNFLRVSEFPNVQTLLAVQYDDMVLAGTAQLISNLEQVLGVTAQCTPYTGRATVARRPLEDDFVTYLRDHVDWDAEALVGFTPRDVE